ncbi:PQ loop repeat containing protein 2 [Echinococcus multilocularis]|uniref:PQ loop repeat containing protein 2 n=1 Tax=Echinococcus multilocularis TaxID=6211 RepID=A0A087W0Q5_ECHMU|nr:PQ loop repeat containing protein 2 [Echinococcus multilocularis]
MSTTPLPGSLEAECPGGLDWAWYGLGECIRSTRDKVSVAFGVMSIAAWFLFGFPQIYENCVKKIPDAAVSIYLLLFWLLGDTLNFVGAFLTNQLFLQKFLAGYTVLVDIILWIQYLYYLWLHKRRKKHLDNEFVEEGELKEKEISVRSPSASTVGKTLATALLGVLTLSFLPVSLTFGGSGPSDYSLRMQRQLFSSSATDPWANFLSTPGEKVGYVFGWTSAIMYVLGRVHQIYMNWRRKCTEGLSFYLFFLAVLGNTFYGCQIFVKSIDAVFVVKSLPWILGSLGILLFDAFILMQFFMYRHNQMDAEEGFEFASEDDEGNIRG